MLSGVPLVYISQEWFWDGRYWFALIWTAPRGLELVISLFGRNQSSRQQELVEQKSEIIEEHSVILALNWAARSSCLTDKFAVINIRDYSVSAPTRQIQIIMRTVNRRTVYNLQFQWSSRLLWKQCLLTKLNKEQVISNYEHAKMDRESIYEGTFRSLARPILSIISRNLRP